MLDRVTRTEVFFATVLLGLICYLLAPTLGWAPRGVVFDPRSCADIQTSATATLRTTVRMCAVERAKETPIYPEKEPKVVEHAPKVP